MKKRILFVDDEKNILQGLERMLRGMRGEWDMRFAESGAMALAMMKNEPFDVVVADMRMPGMDGGELLGRIKDLDPQVVRIVLSGHSEMEMVMKAVRTAHQYLAKPCDADTLRSTIVRACTLRDTLDHESLRKLVSRIDSLPSLPSLYAELLEELESPRSSMENIGRIISRDLGMAAKVLQLVNSAFFGLPRRIEEPAQAVTLLGIETVKTLILGIEVFTKFEGGCMPDLDLEGLWSHSLAVGSFSRILARLEKQPKDQVDQAFVGGMLHDIGKLILASYCPEEYSDILRPLESAEDPGFLWHAERNRLGTGHAEVGAYLLGLWGFPDPVMESVAFHHTPSSHPERSFGPVAAVHVADVLSRTPGEIGHEGLIARGLDLRFLQELGLDGRLPAWQEACGAVLREETIHG